MIKPLLAGLMLLVSSLAQAQTITIATLSTYEGCANSEVRIKGRGMLSAARVFFGTTPLARNRWVRDEDGYPDSVLIVTLPSGLSGSQPLGVSYDTLQAHAVYSSLPLSIVAPPPPTRQAYGPFVGQKFARKRGAAPSFPSVYLDHGLGMTWVINSTPTGGDSIRFIAPSAAPRTDSFPGTTVVSKTGNSYTYLQQTPAGLMKLGTSFGASPGDFFVPARVEIPYGLAFSTYTRSNSQITSGTRVRDAIFSEENHSVGFVGHGNLVLNGVTYYDLDLFYAPTYTNSWDYHQTADPGPYADLTMQYYFYEKGLSVPRLRLSVDVGGDAEWVETPQVNPMTVASFLPAAGTPGTQVTLKGSSLYDVASVFYGATKLPATAWQRLTDTTLTLTIPANATASAAIGVSYDSLASHAVYTAAPFQLLQGNAVITAIRPNTGRIDDTVRIRGRNFRMPVTLRFGGATALYAAVESDTIIRAAVPPGAVTGIVNG